MHKKQHHGSSAETASVRVSSIQIIPKPYKIVVDRTEGIRYAISIAKPGDIIVIPGLGHDLYLERNGVKYPYDERKVIAQIIDEMIASGERQAIS